LRNLFTMNSESRQNAEAIIDKVFELLDERHLYEIIDEPIEKATDSFTFDNKTPMTHDYFIETTSLFVRHIYQQGLFIRQELSLSQASSETIALLEKGYKSAYTTGYYAAYLDALNDIKHVLVQISDHIKLVSRARYQRWVYVSYIDSLDWAVKCRIVDTLIKCSTCLPPNITNCPPVRLVDDIPELIDRIISSEHLAYHSLSAGFPDSSA